MPKTVKKYSKRYTKRRAVMKKRYTGPKTTNTKGVAGGTRNFNVLNTVKPQVYLFKDTLQFNNIVGTGAAVVGVNNFDISQLPRYNALRTMFKRYKIVNAKWRFRLRTIELTDQAEHPNILLRYNYDPDLVVGSISENYMLRQSNVIQKQFIHNTPEGCNLEYSIKPAVMGARKVISGSDFKPNPLFNQWLDFNEITNGEIQHYGIQYWLSTLPAGQTIDLDLQVTYCCKDLV